MDEFQWPEDVTDEQYGMVSAILWVLKEGPVEDASGRASKILADMLVERGFNIPEQSALTKYLNAMDVTTKNARYGSLIRRKRSTTRTHRIELAIDPRKDPFPENPFEGFIDTSPDDEEPELDLDRDLAEADDAAAVEDIPELEAADEPGHELVPVDDSDITIVDRLLYAQSTIADAIAQITEEDAERRHENLAEKFELIERLVRENEEHKATIREQARAIRQLNRALHHADPRANARRR